MTWLTEGIIYCAAGVLISLLAANFGYVAYGVWNYWKSKHK